ncbi:FeoA family protein [Ichthyobacterium seriolicida]|nr:FeoA family protein [Ichthyobacterium seriolicida]
MHRSVLDMKIGEIAIIMGYIDGDIPIRLLNMGCIPDGEVCLKCMSPFGDLLCLKLLDCDVAIRREEARKILLK